MRPFGLPVSTPAALLAAPLLLLVSSSEAAPQGSTVPNNCEVVKDLGPFDFVGRGAWTWQPTKTGPDFLVLTVSSVYTAVAKSHPLTGGERNTDPIQRLSTPWGVTVQVPTENAAVCLTTAVDMPKPGFATRTRLCLKPKLHSGGHCTQTTELYTADPDIEFFKLKH